MKKIIAKLRYMQGYIRDGHLELELNEAQYHKFMKLPLEDKEKWLIEEADRIADDYEVNDISDIRDITVEDA